MTTDAQIENEIVAKGLIAARVTPADIEANIASVHYFTAADGVYGAGNGVAQERPGALSYLTFCVLVLRNGFTVTGESACASPENFDADIGKKIARQNAVQKIWPLMGYALKEQLYQSQVSQPASTLAPHQQRVIEEQTTLADKLAKLTAFIGTAPFLALSGLEQGRLRRQAFVMDDYNKILLLRIDAYHAA